MKMSGEMLEEMVVCFGEELERCHKHTPVWFSFCNILDVCY